MRQLLASADKPSGGGGGVPNPITDPGGFASWLIQPPHFGDPNNPNTVNAGDLLNPVAKAAEKGAEAAAVPIAKAVGNTLWDAIAKPPSGSPEGTPSPAAKMLLYLVLVGGGLALALGGVRSLAHTAQEQPA
jgi:hypothetical protein